MTYRVESNRAAKPAPSRSNFGSAGNAGTVELIARGQPGYFFLPSLSVLLIFLLNQVEIPSEADFRNKVGLQPRPYFFVSIFLGNDLLLVLLILLLFLLYLFLIILFLVLWRSCAEPNPRCSSKSKISKF